MSMFVLAITSLLSALDPEGVIATAPAGRQAVAIDAVAPTTDAVPAVSAAQAVTPHGLTTDEQIDRWISARTAADKPFADDGDPWAAYDDRKIHGEVSAGIGTGDYSAYSAAVSLPIGENGRIDLRYSQSKNDPWGYGYGYDRPGYGWAPGYGYGYGGYGYRTGRSQSVGISFQSDSSAGRERPADLAPRPFSSHRLRTSDPAAPLTVSEE